MTTTRATALSIFVAVTLAGGSAWAGGPARQKGFLRAPRQYVRDYRAFKAKHDLKPLAGADYHGKVKPHKAFRQMRKTGVTPDNVKVPQRMAMRMKQLGERVKTIQRMRDATAGISHRTDQASVEWNVRAAMTTYAGAVSDLREAEAFGQKHEVGDRTALRAVAIELRDLMAPQIDILMKGQDHSPQRFGADMLTAGLAGATAREGYMADRARAVTAHRTINRYIETGRFDDAE
jgi:hypothetical protein